MTIETLAGELIAALKENTAELRLARGEKPAAGAKAPAASAGRKPAAKSKYTIDQVVAKAVELKDVIGREETVKFVAIYGARASKDLKPEIWDQFVADVDERIKLEQEGGAPAEGDDEV